MFTLKATGAERRRIAFEADLSRDQIVEQMAMPYNQKQTFFCGGTVVEPSRVERIQFAETQVKAEDIIEKARARMRSSRVVATLTPSIEVISSGRDITREILSEVSAQITPAKEERFTKSDRVFVVHGHDHRAVDQAENLLHRFGLKPVILRDAPSAGRTVIEKFEGHSDVGAAIVLLTPDDLGGIDEAHLAPRARQNVIWEWGYLVSKLGRPNVICVYKGGVEIPSDLHGIVTIHVGDDVKEKAEEIRRELTAAGYVIP